MSITYEQLLRFVAFWRLFDENLATTFDVDALMSWTGKFATLQVVEGTIYFVEKDSLNGGCAILVNFCDFFTLRYRLHLLSVLSVSGNLY